MDKYSNALPGAKESACGYFGRVRLFWAQGGEPQECVCVSVRWAMSEGEGEHSGEHRS